MFGCKKCKVLKKNPEKEKRFLYPLCKVNSMPLVRLNEEHTEYGYFKIDSLHNFPYLIDDKIAQAIQEI